MPVLPRISYLNDFVSWVKDNPDSEPAEYLRKNIGGNDTAVHKALDDAMNVIAEEDDRRGFGPTFNKGRHSNLMESDERKRACARLNAVGPLLIAAAKQVDKIGGVQIREYTDAVAGAKDALWPDHVPPRRVGSRAAGSAVTHGRSTYGAVQDVWKETPTRAINKSDAPPALQALVEAMVQEHGGPIDRDVFSKLVEKSVVSSHGRYGRPKYGPRVGGPQEVFLLDRWANQNISGNLKAQSDAAQAEEVLFANTPVGRALKEAIVDSRTP